MRKLTKTTLTIAACFTLLFIVNSCQEDVLPTLDYTESELFDAADQEYETDPDDKDEGVVPRL